MAHGFLPENPKHSLNLVLILSLIVPLPRSFLELSLSKSYLFKTTLVIKPWFMYQIGLVLFISHHSILQPLLVMKIFYFKLKIFRIYFLSTLPDCKMFKVLLPYSAFNFLKALSSTAYFTKSVLNKYLLNLKIVSLKTKKKIILKG